MILRTRSAFVSLGLLALACACGSETETVEAPPAQLHYSLQFTSVGMAVATESIRVAAYRGEGDICPDLIERQKTGQDLPTATAQTPFTTPCQLASGSPSASMELKFGSFAFFAIGTRANQPFVIGCTVVQVSGSSTDVPISLTLANNQVAVPVTQCTRLSEFCGPGC